MADQSDLREYNTTKLPTLKNSADKDYNNIILLAVYTETCNSWRQLVDVRFRLLALVPGASIFIAAMLADRSSNLQISERILAGLMCLAGLAAVFGLWIYDSRNDELHDDLISRARKIEEELGLDTGAFLGRKKPTRDFICHGNAKKIVYLAAGSAWLLAAAAVISS